MIDAQELTETEIVNMAFDLIEQPPIMDLSTDLSLLGQAALRLFPRARDLALKRHWWTPLRVDVDLPAVAAPADDGTILVQLPNDCLHVWLVAGQRKGFERRDGPGTGRIVTVAPAPVRVTYARNIATGKMPIELAVFMAAVLADLMKNSAGVKLSAAKLRDLDRVLIDREMQALNILGAEGGDDDVIGSRYLDAVHGVC